MANDYQKNWRGILNCMLVLNCWKQIKNSNNLEKQVGDSACYFVQHYLHKKTFVDLIKIFLIISIRVHSPIRYLLKTLVVYHYTIKY